MTVGEVASWSFDDDGSSGSVTLRQESNDTIVLSRGGTPPEEITFSRTSAECPRYVSASETSDVENFLVYNESIIASKLCQPSNGNSTVSSTAGDAPPPSCDSYFTDIQCDGSTCTGHYEEGDDVFDWTEVRFTGDPQPGFGLREIQLERNGQETLRIQLGDWNGL